MKECCHINENGKKRTILYLWITDGDGPIGLRKVAEESESAATLATQCLLDKFSIHIPSTRWAHLMA